MAFDLEFRRWGHAVPQCGERHALHVVGRGETAAVHERAGTRGANQRDAAARAGARGDAVPGPGRAHDTHHVVLHGIVHGHRRRQGLKFEHILGLDQAVNLFDIEFLADLAGCDAF